MPRRGLWCLALKLRLVTALATAALAACPAPTPRPANPPPATKPGLKLVVLVVIDQWPEWAFEQKRTAFSHGFARLLEDGEWHVGRYPSAATLTGPDHAMLGTGEPPSRSGIVADEWWHRDLGQALEAVHDADGSVTDRWLRVPGLGDAIAASHTDAKAIDIALKPRVAVLPLGHAGTRIWYDPKQAAFTSFAGQVPSWVDTWNRDHPISAHLHDIWTPADESRVIALSGVADANPGEVGSETMGPTFPHDVAATKNPAKSILTIPFGNDIVVELGTRAIEAEQLGKHHAADFLVLGFSAHDYVGHGWGQESWEMWDMELRLDERLGELMDTLDRTIGPDGWAMVVTSDHGATPLPEKVGGGRLVMEKLQEIANNAASAVLGEGKWFEAFDYPAGFESKAMLAQPRSERVSAEKRVIDALRAIPGIARAGRVSEVIGDCDKRTGDERVLCLTFDRDRSGEIYYMTARGWLHQEQDEPEATGHGSLYEYDREVPFIVMLPGRARHAPWTAPVAPAMPMEDVAGLLAALLGVPAPTNLPR